MSTLRERVSDRDRERTVSGYLKRGGSYQKVSRKSARYTPGYLEREQQTSGHPEGGQQALRPWQIKRQEGERHWKTWTEGER